MSMTLIATVTVGSGGAANITFSSISQLFTDILVIGSFRDSASDVRSNVNILLNANTASNSSARRLFGSGSAVASDNFSGLTSVPGAWTNSANATANTFSNFQIYIPNYAGSTNKSISMDSVTENNATAEQQGLTAGLWASTSAITSIELGSGFTLQQHSTASLYGILKGSGGATVS